MASGRIPVHRRLVTAPLFGVFALCWPYELHAQCTRYEVETIPGPDCTFVYSASIGRGINPAGEVCGSWSDCSHLGHGSIWPGQGPWQTFPLPPGVAWISLGDMNSARHIAAVIPGSPNPQLYRAAFVDFPNGTMTILSIPPSGNFAEALAINESDVVCGVWGNSATGNPALQAYTWQNGRMTSLVLPFGTDSYAYDISETGFVTGWMGTTPNIDAHAYRWLNGQTIDLGTVLPGAIGADARGVSNSGAVCGFSVYLDEKFTYVRRGFLWQDGMAQDLGILPGFLHTRAWAVNDSNVVIGYCDDFPINAQGGTAFVWRDGQMTALDDLIPSDLNLHIDIVGSINGVGQIVGLAEVLDNSGDQIAVRLTPVPPGPGDCNCDDVVNIDDLLTIVNQWGAAGGPGDLNHDNTVNIDDLILIINNWG